MLPRQYTNATNWRILLPEFIELNHSELAISDNFGPKLKNITALLEHYLIAIKSKLSSKNRLCSIKAVCSQTLRRQKRLHSPTVINRNQQ